MKEIAPLTGVVSAYDAKTGKVIFKDLHNVVTSWEKLNLLRHLIASPVDFIVDAEGPTKTKYQQTKMQDSNKITQFLVGGIEGNAYPVENQETALDPGPYKFPIDFFTPRDSYQPAGITDEMIAAGANLIYTVEGGAFIRFKLAVCGNNPTSGKNSLAIQPGDSKEINFIALVLDNDERATQFRFPAITFYSTTEVVFEYRLYL